MRVLRSGRVRPVACDGRPAQHAPAPVNERGAAISSKIFVGNLSFQTTSEELESLFRQAGDVVSVVVPTDRDTGRPRGFGFVEFASEEAAADAISRFHGVELGGRNLRVNEAEDRPPRSSSGFGRPYPGGGNSERRPPRPKGSRRNIRGRKRSIG